MRQTLKSPLARWGFTICALTAWANHLTTPFIISACLAATAWHTRHR